MKTTIYIFAIGVFAICLFSSFNGTLTLQSGKGKIPVDVYIDTCLHSPLHVQSLPDSCRIRVFTAGQQVEHPVKKFIIALVPPGGQNAYFEEINGRLISPSAMARLRGLKPNSTVLVADLTLGNGTDYIVHKGGTWKVAP